MALYHQIVFIGLLAFVLHTQQDDAAFLEKWNKIREECAAQEKINLADAKKAWEENSFPDDSKFKCYYKCTNTKMGVLDDKGEVVDDVLGEVSSHFNDKATRDEIVEECGPLKGADLCETAFKLMKCIKAAKLD